MQSEKLVVEKAILVEEASSNVNCILRKHLYQNFHSSLETGVKGKNILFVSQKELEQNLRVQCLWVIRPHRILLTIDRKHSMGTHISDMKLQKCSHGNYYHCIKVKQDYDNLDDESDSKSTSYYYVHPSIFVCIYF